MEEDIDCCKYCRFYRDKNQTHHESFTDQMDGYCQKNPPSFPNHGFPPTYHDWWCGCFDGNKEWDRLREERKPKIGHPGEVISGEELRRRELEMIRKYKETL